MTYRTLINIIKTYEFSHFDSFDLFEPDINIGEINSLNTLKACKPNKNRNAITVSTYDNLFLVVVDFLFHN